MIHCRKVGPHAVFEQPSDRPTKRVDSCPVDLDFLAKQTFGDRALAEEILGLFCTQIRQAEANLSRATLAERQTIAHSVKGSALSVGAHKLAAVAERIEVDGNSAEALADFADGIARIRQFCAGLFR